VKQEGNNTFGKLKTGPAANERIKTQKRARERERERERRKREI
jgi:hypothetical protein